MNIHLDFDSVFEKYDRETTLDTFQSLAKIAARSISFAGYFDSTPELAQGKEIISGIQAVFTLRSTFNSIGKIIKQVTKDDENDKPELADTLKTAAATIGVATGLLSIFKFCMSQKEIIEALSQISTSLGGTAVVGEAVISSLFLNHIASALGLLQSVISITVDSIYIHERNKKIDSAKQKLELWNQPLDKARVQLKISTISHKQSLINNETEAIALKLIKISEKAKTALHDYEEQKATFKKASGLKKISTWVVLKSKKKEAKKQISKNLNKAEELNQCIEKQILSFNKLNTWKELHAKWDNLNAEDTQKIADFQQDKAIKWTTKQKSLKIEQIKAAVGLTLKVIGFIMTIAALILSGAGVAIVPVLITMTTISLLLAVTSFGFTLFKRHTSPITVDPVPPPSLI